MKEIECILKDYVSCVQPFDVKNDSDEYKYWLHINKIKLNEYYDNLKQKIPQKFDIFNNITSDSFYKLLYNLNKYR